MSLLIVLSDTIARLYPTRSADTGPSGADAVRTAVSEIEGLQNEEFTALLGEPDIIEGTGRYFNDPRIVVPIVNAPFDSADRLVFDLPRGRRDNESQFTELLEIFGVDFDNMEELDGETVPVQFFGGNLTVLWNEMDSDTDKGGGDDPHTKEDVEDFVEPPDEDPREDQPSVNIEETTVTGDEDDA